MKVLYGCEFVDGNLVIGCTEVCREETLACCIHFLPNLPGSRYQVAGLMETLVNSHRKILDHVTPGWIVWFCHHKRRCHKAGCCFLFVNDAFGYQSVEQLIILGLPVDWNVATFGGRRWDWYLRIQFKVYGLTFHFPSLGKTCLKDIAIFEQYGPGEGWSQSFPLVVQLASAILLVFPAMQD